MRRKIRHSRTENSSHEEIRTLTVLNADRSSRKAGNRGNGCTSDGRGAEDLAGHSPPAQMSILAREDDVLFCPGMDLLAMRAGHFSALDFCSRPQFFFDRLTA